VDYSTSYFKGGNNTMQLVLNIYDPETKVIVKQYTVESIDILYGTFEDIIEAIDENKLDDNMELAKVILVSLKKIKPLLKQVFVGLTDEELKNAKVKELIPLFINIIKGMMSEFKSLGDGSKN